MMNIKTGDTVTIYKRPITREHPEGTATILKLLDFDENAQTFDVCVRFKGESATYRRTIYVGPDEMRRADATGHNLGAGAWSD